MSATAPIDLRDPYLPSRREKGLLVALVEALEPLFDARDARVAEPLPTVGDEKDPWQGLVNGPTTTGGAASVIPVAGVAGMWPLSVMCRLTTSALVADRTVAVEYRDANGQRFVVAGTQAATQANGQQSYCWYVGAGSVTWPVEDAAIAGLPAQYLAASQSLAIVVSSGQVGDVLDQVVVSARFVPDPSDEG